MIEWVPIKDFDLTDVDQYLICHKDSEGKYGVGLRYSFVQDYVDWFNGTVVTHAAKINFPVEKTLEDK